MESAQSRIGADPPEVLTYINLKLAALGQPTSQSTNDPYFLDIAGPLLRNHLQKNLLLAGRLCPADTRIQAFLDDYLQDVTAEVPKIPSNTFVLDRPGLARALSLPPKGDRMTSPYLNSYRVAQGVLHNPSSDRRTTTGIFHITEGGLPIPADKLAAPKIAFAALLGKALSPPADVQTIPFTADQADQARLLVSLLLRPVVCPASARDEARSMEIRFFAPGSLVSNLDFVENIFSNAGDPYLPENDAALDGLHWTGHTGCVILAPHLLGVCKKELGLPHFDQATERQRRDGMCWREESEPYNEGRAFKITCRDARGVMVTIIADNYYGYCKKEVKTQISFSANLFGGCEEEHAGGAIAFPTFVLGEDFYVDRTLPLKKTTFEEAMTLLDGQADLREEGYAVDRRYPDVFYVPANVAFNVREGYVRWEHNGATHQIKLLAYHEYVLPSGYSVHLEKQPGGATWRLVGSSARGTLCHKPCTVSGGGKSEISKSLANVMLNGPVFVSDYSTDMDEVTAILARDFSTIYRHPRPGSRASRPILSPDRTLGSVIKLLTPSPDYTAEYNEWLRSLPQIIRQLVFTIKRYYRPDWGSNWREHFTVDRINGVLGNELKYDNQKLTGNYLRVGYDPDGAWRIYKLRPDFHPAEKVQVEDDISASTVLPREQLNDLSPEQYPASVKILVNCEKMLFQRPDDAIHRGMDAQAEADIASPGTFLSNFEPLTSEQARDLADQVTEFDRWTEPMKKLILGVANEPSPGYVVSSAHPRIVDGKPSKNPRYLQPRPDLVQYRLTYLAEVRTRLERGVPLSRKVFFPVDAVLPGRRNNPPDVAAGLPPLAVYNPIHYQELPELFMDFIASLTGKSPSTTGFGSEGALTKGPFNALWPVVDLNNALVSAVLTGHGGFTTAAGYVGPRYRVDHDVTMIVPEIWCRMSVEERDPQFLIENGYLEKMGDFVYEGETILVSRLGYRVTQLFADHFLGRLFETPDAIFISEILRPEEQDLDVFVAGVRSIVATQAAVANNYFEDGSVEAACPPLRALLHIMAHGHFEGKGVDAPEIRGMFTRESVLSSDWYAERLNTKKQRDTALWQRHVAALEAFRSDSASGTIGPADLEQRLAASRKQLARVSAPSYLGELAGTIGADPFHRQLQR